MTTPTKPARGATDLDIVRAALDDDYEVLKELGRGGMAVVYLARERALDREVAIKVLPFTLAFDDALVERFTREARTAARLEHPHIIPVYRVGQAASVTYFVMKLVRGQSLSDRLLERGPLAPAEARRILTETAGALAYAHQHGVVHRDVKPDNILLDESGRCVVTDFGIARTGSDSRLTATGMSMGTPRYMSPEQARAKEVDGRSDIYSLGVVGYECLTGRTPFDGADMLEILMAHISNPVPRPALASDEARALYTVIERMLAKAPEQRFTSGDELVAALKGEIEVAPLRISTPTVLAPAHATLPNGAAVALRNGVAAGAELLRQQRPRVEAGLAAGKRAIDEQAPRVRSVLARARDRITEGVRRVLTYEAANRRRVWTLGAGAAITLIGGYYGAHFAMHHRSRCPSVASGGATADSGGGGGSAARRFTLMLDDGGSIRPNGDADVYYDVCGLEDGASFSTRIVISRSGSGLSRLFGQRVDPVVGTFDETAGGPAVRRHRTFDLDGKPSGTYRISVIVTDEKGRRREEGTSLRVSEK